MYEAFAAGEQGTIREICAEGLREKMVTRIHNRIPGETFKWEIVTEGRARVVSHRAAPLPGENCGIRQAVVRIKSTQMLTRYDRDGQVFGGFRETESLHRVYCYPEEDVSGQGSAMEDMGNYD